MVELPVIGEQHFGLSVTSDREAQLRLKGALDLDEPVYYNVGSDGKLRFTLSETTSRTLGRLRTTLPVITVMFGWGDNTRTRQHQTRDGAKIYFICTRIPDQVIRENRAKDPAAYSYTRIPLFGSHFFGSHTLGVPHVSSKPCQLGSLTRCMATG